MPLDKDIKNVLDPLLASFSLTLETTIEGNIVETYVSGQAEMITWGKTKAGVPIAYEGPPISRAIEWAKGHVSKAKLVDGINEETRKQLSKVIADGIKNKRGIPGIKSDIRHKLDWMARGAPSDIKGLTLASRAELIARTETAEALSQASLDNMEAMGIDGKEWITSGSAISQKDECGKNQAQGIIPVGQAFSSGHQGPPAHPDAVFEGYDFSPYGSLIQMVSSRYDGPAMALEVKRIENVDKLPSRDIGNLIDSFDGDIVRKHSDGNSDLLVRNRSGETISIFPQWIQLTIGPNHPVLTRRGFVKAQFLHKDDELLYDIRSKLSAWCAKPDFKKILLIENVFESLATVSGYTDIPAPGNYFHGDEVFCNGEIKVVRPTGNLLSIGDASIIEHLGKCNLTSAYTNAEHVAGCSSCQSTLKSVFATTSSSMGSSRHVEPSLRGQTSPSFFQSYRVVGVHKTSYIGMAFDASTSTKLYNIGGLVVKNCECVVAPAILRR